jgi:MinD superfamily P-loop ATPase
LKRLPKNLTQTRVLAESERTAASANASGEAVIETETGTGTASEAAIETEIATVIATATGTGTDDVAQDLPTVRVLDMTSQIRIPRAETTVSASGNTDSEIEAMTAGTEETEG